MIRADYLRPTCAECGRRFDLTDAADAEEWAYGHDCEVPEDTLPAEALQAAARICDSGPDAFARGAAALLAELHPVPGMDRDTRADRIMQDIQRAART